MSSFAPHPNPLPMNLAIRSLIAVKSIVAKFMGRGDFLCKASRTIYYLPASERWHFVSPVRWCDPLL